MQNSITTIYINSKERNSGTVSNFSYILPQGISNSSDYYVKSVSIPFSSYVTIYPAEDGGDPSFQISDPGGLHNVILSPGNYSSASAGVTLQTALNTASGGNNYTVTYNASTYRYTITENGSSNFDIYWSSSDQHPEQNISYTFGFPVTTLSGSPAYTSTQVASASGTSYNYYIKSQSLTINGCYSYFNGIKDSVICQVPLNTSPNGLIQYNDQLGQWIPLRGINLYNIDIQLVDENNIFVDLNGLEWTMTLVVRNKFI